MIFSITLHSKIYYTNVRNKRKCDSASDADGHSNTQEGKSYVFIPTNLHLKFSIFFIQELKERCYGHKPQQFSASVFLRFGPQRTRRYLVHAAGISKCLFLPLLQNYGSHCSAL